MAIGVNGGNGGNGRRRSRGGAALSEINVTPFVDVVLVLLIIFMLTAHVMEYGFEVDVPKTQTVEQSVQDLPVVNISKDSDLYLNDQQVNINNLVGAIRNKYGAKGNSVYLRADKDSTWDVIAQVMSQLGAAKIVVNVVTQPEDMADKRKR